jgi:phage gp45-like
VRTEWKLFWYRGRCCNVDAPHWDFYYTDENGINGNIGCAVFSREDAYFIVKAVNKHDKMKDALKKIGKCESLDEAKELARHALRP